MRSAWLTRWPLAVAMCTVVTAAIAVNLAAGGDGCSLPSCWVADEAEEAALLQRHQVDSLQVVGAADHAAEALNGPPKYCPVKAAKLCAALRSAISKGQVFCGESLKNYSFDAFNPQCRQLLPAFAVRPKSAEEVQAVVKITRQHKWGAFSIAGGGHGYTCNGFKKNSVHLDMRDMRESSFTEDSTHGYARLGPGLLLQDLPNIIPDSFQYATGTCPTVGVVGYLVHGGSSPRTTWLGNTTLHRIDVVTADGKLLTLSNESPYRDLWYAMRMAGSSFGAVTSLTIKLERKPQRGFMFVPTNASFLELLASLEPPASDAETWKGLFRFDLMFPSLGGKWMLKLSPPGAVSQSDLALVQSIGASGVNVAAPSGVPWLQDVLSWARRNKLDLDLSSAFLDPEDAWAKLGTKKWGGRSEHQHEQHWSSYPARLRWAAEGHTGELGITDMGSTGRFVHWDHYKHIATVEHEFFEKYPSNCWFDLGPVKFDGESVFLDLSCYTVESTHALSQFVNEHRRLLDEHAVRYYNLPLWRTPRAVIWPNYDELSAIKARWDPSNFFGIPDGIQPPGWKDGQ